MQESSNYQVDVEVNAQSQIVSLSTCTNVKEDEISASGVLAGSIDRESIKSYQIKIISKY